MDIQIELGHISWIFKQVGPYFMDIQTQVGPYFMDIKHK